MVVYTYALYDTFPVAFVVRAVVYHQEWFIRGKDPQPVEERASQSALNIKSQKNCCWARASGTSSNLPQYSFE
jgi:hypothetical protein